MLPLLLVALVGAVVSMAVITPRVNELWIPGQTAPPEFWKWHGISQSVYLVELVCLLTSALLIPAAIRADAEPSMPFHTTAGA